MSNRKQVRPVQEVWPYQRSVTSAAAPFTAFDVEIATDFLNDGWDDCTYYFKAYIQSFVAGGAVAGYAEIKASFKRVGGVFTKIADNGGDLTLTTAITAISIAKNTDNHVRVTATPTADAGLEHFAFLKCSVCRPAT